MTRIWVSAQSQGAEPLLLADSPTQLTARYGTAETPLKLFCDSRDGGSVWQTFGKNWGGAQRRETGERVRCQLNDGDTNLASNTSSHQTETNASSLRLALYLPLTPLSPSFTKERGWCRPLPPGGGDAKSSPVSPCSHSWWAWHEKKELWAPRGEREG